MLIGANMISLFEVPLMNIDAKSVLFEFNEKRPDLITSSARAMASASCAIQSIIFARKALQNSLEG